MAALETIEFDPRGDVKLRVGSADESISTVFLVCSRTLSRVSPVFDRMLYGAFAESKYGGAASTGEWIVNLPEDKPAPLALLAHITHCNFSRVPRALSIDDLYELTALTHYYDATRILTPWLGAWVTSADELVRDEKLSLLKFLWITWELGHKERFETTARRILMEAPASIFASDSPLHTLTMPPDIIERIAAIRTQTIRELLDLFRDIVEKLLVVDENPRWCRHATFLGPHRCESMILGSMTFCLTRSGLWPLPEAADVEDCVMQLYTKLMGLVIHDIGETSEKITLDHRECNPRPYLVNEMKKIMDDIPDPVTDFHRKRIDQQSRNLYI